MRMVHSVGYDYVLNLGLPTLEIVTMKSKNFKGIIFIIIRDTSHVTNTIVAYGCRNQKGTCNCSVGSRARSRASVVRMYSTGSFSTNT